MVVTSDNPRTEKASAILSEIEAGVRQTGLKKFPVSGFASRPGEFDSERGYFMEADRRMAIRAALHWAVPGDVVLIAGKGHEDYQILGTEKIHFDDREVAREELAARAGA